MTLGSASGRSPMRRWRQLRKYIVLLAFVVFTSASFGQAIAPAGSIPVQITDFYKSATQKELRHKLVAPSAMAIGRSASVYIFDDGNSRIVQINRRGRFVNEFGYGGNSDSQVSPSGLSAAIAVDAAENVYVADTVKSKVQIFNSKGKFIRSFRVPFLIEGLAVNGAEEVFVSVTSSKTIPLVYVFSRSGALLRSFGERIVTQPGELPKQVNRTLITTDAEGGVLMAFRHWPIVRRYARFGKLLEESSFKVPSEIVRESQRERYSLSFIANHPDADYSLPLLTHSISVDQSGTVFLLLNGHNVVKLTRNLRVMKEGHLQGNLSGDTTFVKLVAPGAENVIYLLDIRSAGIYKASGL